MKQALDIYQRFLDEVSPHLLSGDVDPVLSRFAMPFQLRTTDTELLCPTRVELRHSMKAYSGYLRFMGVTGLRRVAEDARFRSPEDIEGFHVTEVIQNDAVVVKPYVTRMRMRSTDGLWYAAETDSVVLNSDWKLVADACPGARVIPIRSMGGRT